MANYCCATRSSYFYVKDEETYEEFMKHIVTSEDSLESWDKKKDDGRIAHAFGCYSQILGYVDDPEGWEKYGNAVDVDYGKFLQKLSEIIAPGSACVIMQSGNEKLRYVDGFVDVVMHNKVKSENLENNTRNILKDNGIDPDHVELYY